MNPIEWLINKIISFIFATIPQPRPQNEALTTCKIVAHRGVHEAGLATENTLAAFRLALENQIWAVELDVRFTQDHIPVVTHDGHCVRVFGIPDLDIHLTDFKTLRNMVPELPTLAEVVSEFGKKLHLMIELKVYLDKEPNKLNNFKQALAPLEPITDYHLLTLDPERLAACNFAPKAAFMDVMWLNPRYILKKNAQLGHGCTAGHFLFLKSNTIRQLQKQGKKVGVGFLDSRNSLYREINRGVDYIFTNHPLRLKNYLTKPS